MSVPNKQIGWSTESNLLWDVLNKINKLKSVIYSSVSNALQIANIALSNATAAQSTANSTKTAFETTIKIQSLGTISGNISIDLSQGTTVLATLSGPVTFSFTSLPAVGYETAFSLRLSGIFQITFPVGTKFANDIAPTLEAPLYELPCSIDSAGNVIVYGAINKIDTI